jgi:hypothetical protein
MYLVLITLHIWEIKVTFKSKDIRELKKGNVPHRYSAYWMKEVSLEMGPGFGISNSIV